MNQKALWDLVSNAKGSQSDDSGDDINFLDQLFNKRIVLLTGVIGDLQAHIVIAKLLALAVKDSKKDILMVINSPGGAVSSGLAIYDVMQTITPDVATVCIGDGVSMGAVLLTAGAKGKRFILPHASTMIHQPWGQISGSADEIAAQSAEIQQMKSTLVKILAKHTGQPFDRIRQDIDRKDYWMTAKEAVDYGLVDKLIEEKGSLV